MYCKRCKKENPNDSTFCIYCGKKLKVTRPKINKSVIYTILIILLIFGIALICKYYMNVKEYKIFTDTGDIEIKIDEGIIQKGITNIRERHFEPINRMGVIYNQNNEPQHYLVLASGDGFREVEGFEGSIFEIDYNVYSIDIKTGETKAGITRAPKETGTDKILKQGAEKIIESGESFAIFNFKSGIGTFVLSREEDYTVPENTSSDDENTGSNLQYPQEGELLPISPGLTGIEQAVKNGELDEDILQGTSEEMLTYIFKSDNGRLKYYYHSLEECLQDAKKLNILREATEEELKLINGPTYKD